MPTLAGGALLSHPTGGKYCPNNLRSFDSSFTSSINLVLFSVATFNRSLTTAFSVPWAAK